MLLQMCSSYIRINPALITQQLQKLETQTEAHVTLFEKQPTIAAATVVLLERVCLFQLPEFVPMRFIVRLYLAFDF